MCNEPQMRGDNPSETKVVSLLSFRCLQIRYLRTLIMYVKALGTQSNSSRVNPNSIILLLITGAWGRSKMIKGPHPGNTLLSQRTRKEQVLGSFRAATKAHGVKMITERDKLIGCVGVPMCYPPVQVRNLLV